MNRFLRSGNLRPAKPRLKGLLLAAASVAAAGAVIGGAAHAASAPEFGPPATAPTYLVDAPQAVAADAAIDAATAPVSGRKMALWAAAAGVLALLTRLIGWRNVAASISSAGPVIARTAAAVARAPVAAARAVAGAVMSPVRFGLLLAAGALFAFTGVWLLDSEWTGGLLVGASLATLALFGFQKSRAALASVVARVRPQPRRSGMEQNRD